MRTRLDPRGTMVSLRGMKPRLLLALLVSASVALGATDIGNKAAIGGLARSFYEQIAAHYEKPAAWKWEQPHQSAALASGQEKGADPLVAKTGQPTKWTFEPHVAMAIYQQWLKSAGVQV